MEADQSSGKQMYFLFQNRRRTLVSMDVCNTIFSLVNANKASLQHNIQIQFYSNLLF